MCQLYGFVNEKNTYAELVSLAVFTPLWNR